MSVHRASSFLFIASKIDNRSSGKVPGLCDHHFFGRKEGIGKEWLFKWTKREKMFFEVGATFADADGITCAKSDRLGSPITRFSVCLWVGFSQCLISVNLRHSIPSQGFAHTGHISIWQHVCSKLVHFEIVIILAKNRLFICRLAVSFRSSNQDRISWSLLKNKNFAVMLH